MPLASFDSATGRKLILLLHRMRALDSLGSLMRVVMANPGMSLDWSSLVPVAWLAVLIAAVRQELKAVYVRGFTDLHPSHVPNLFHLSQDSQGFGDDIESYSWNEDEAAVFCESVESQPMLLRKWYDKVAGIVASSAADYPTDLNGLKAEVGNNGDLILQAPMHVLEQIYRKFLADSVSCLVASPTDTNCAFLEARSFEDCGREPDRSSNCSDCRAGSSVPLRLPKKGQHGSSSSGLLRAGETSPWSKFWWEKDPLAHYRAIQQLLVRSMPVTLSKAGDAVERAAATAAVAAVATEKPPPLANGAAMVAMGRSV